MYQWYRETGEAEDITSHYKQAFVKFGGVKEHYLNVIEKFSPSETNLPLLTMVPVAIYGHKLDPDNLYGLVKLVVMITHCHELVVEACYTYCYAIQ